MAFHPFGAALAFRDDGIFLLKLLGGFGKGGFGLQNPRRRLAAKPEIPVFRKGFFLLQPGFLDLSLGYLTPADYAGNIAATGSNATQCGSFALPPVAPTPPFGVSKTAEALKRVACNQIWDSGLA